MWKIKILRKSLSNINEHILSKFLYPANKIKYSSVPRPEHVIYIDPLNIKYSMKNNGLKKSRWICGSIADGDWDLDVEEKQWNNSPRYESFLQRYIEGIPWENTEIFKSHINKRLDNDGEVRGFTTMEDILQD